ncbi:MAG: hypothetical protein QY312_02680 [Candidatus Dojkabacteria bacterium]|nr:MAG: hypothetical protein QY312_02680 [Candidatus Dojkabacteria bacterium]
MRFELEQNPSYIVIYPSNTFNECCYYVLTTNDPRYRQLQAILSKIVTIHDPDVLNEWTSYEKKLITVQQDKKIRESLQKIENTKERDECIIQYCHFYQYDITRMIARKFAQELKDFEIGTAEEIIMKISDIVIRKMASRMRGSESLAAAMSNVIGVAVINEKNLFEKVKTKRQIQSQGNVEVRQPVLDLPASYGDFRHYLHHGYGKFVEVNYHKFDEGMLTRFRMLGEMLRELKERYAVGGEDLDEFVISLIPQFTEWLSRKHEEHLVKGEEAFHKKRLRSSAIQLDLVSKRIFRIANERVALETIARKYQVNRERVRQIEETVWKYFLNFVKVEFMKKFK